LSLRIQTLVTGVFQENCFILWDDTGSECLLIDPGDDAEKISASIQSLGLSPLGILNTHGHIDHIGAVNDLKKEFEIPFYLPVGEKAILELYETTALYFGLKPREKPEVDFWLENESKLTLGPFSFQVYFTPGHTPGGQCYKIENHLFSGDTLFKRSVGRTDLPGGDWNTLEQSLKMLVSEIPEDTLIHSGHGPDTTMARERVENPFLYPLLRELN
jgi:glyoxylase-like metal-dependent hydrolase (beta-lactamase superfamily II)